MTMKHISEAMTDAVVSPWRGSEQTAEMVREQVRERFGDEAADSFNPAEDAMPLISWASFGYRVRKGEKALKSVTYVEVEDDQGNVEKKIRKVVNLFHKRQVEKAA